MKDFGFKKEQLLVRYSPDPIREGTDPNDVLEVEIINRGDRATLYTVGETVLVRRGYIEEIKSPHFKSDEKIIFDENKVLCSFKK